MKEDDTIWHGWYRRHGGEFELIGDHFGGSDATSVLLVLALPAREDGCSEDGATRAARQCAGRSETQVIAIPTQTMNAALATGR